ncbi:MAG: hypothetical protein WC449_06220 [Candidatus Paceibacterota bacterium]
MSDYGYIQVMWEPYETFNNEIYKRLDDILMSAHEYKFERLHQEKPYHTLNGVWKSLNGLMWKDLFIDIYDLFKNGNVESTYKIVVAGEEYVRIIVRLNEECDLQVLNLQEIKKFIDDSIKENDVQMIWDDEQIEKWNKIK